jgi:ribonucleoside-diphosphate reductase beta chain
MNNESGKKLLFNPFGNDSIENRQIIKGNTTNLINLNSTKYNWAKDIYRQMTGNAWFPEKVDLTMDIQGYESLTEGEQRAYDGILSFLVFLDSLQTANLPNVADVITAAEVAMLVTIQNYQEVIHAQSYAYVIETIIPPQRREAIYEFWRDDKTLYERNEYVASLYQKYADEKSDAGLWQVLIANYLLEGLYFYNGFAFFYNLASRSLCSGTSDMIRYINRDELSHCVLFARIIQEIMVEFPEMVDIDLVYKMTQTAVEQEIAWTDHIVGDAVMGITPESTRKYTKHLANKRLAALGLDPLYSAAESKNPYQHLERIADENGDATVKSNFFERTVSSYQQSSGLKKWDY